MKARNKKLDQEIQTRIRIERELHSTEERLEMFFSQSLDGFFFMMLDEPVEWSDTVDKEKVLDYVFEHQRTTRANQAMLDQYRAKQEDFLGLTPARAFSHDLAEGRKVWRKFFDEGRLHIDTDERRFDGSQMWVEGDYVCMYDSEGRITGHFGIQRDVTDRKKADRILAESRSSLEEAMEFAKVGSWSWDIQTNTVEWSDEMFRIFGVDPVDFNGDLNEVIGKAIHPDDIAIVEASNRSVVESGKPVPVEYRVIWPDGSIHWIHAEAGKLILDENSRPKLLKGFAQDTTSRKEVEDRYLQLSKAVEQSPLSIVFTDVKGNIEYVNPRFTEITGYTFEEVSGQNPRVLKSGYTPDEEYARLWDQISSGQEWKGEFYNRKKDGSFYWESASICPVRDEHGVITHYFAIKEDITRDKELIRELQLARRKAEESDMLKSSFINNMSHEIRTPINAIVGFADLLDEPDYSDEEKERFRGLIRASSQHLLSIITDILQISTIETGQILLNKKTFKVVPELKSLQNLFGPIAVKNRVGFHLDISEIPDDFELTTDKTKWTQVLNNLLTNAFKFTAKGEICLGCRLLKKEVEFFVTDTGIGIEPEKQLLIFERFMQADHTISRRFGGSGLGLAISKAYIELMGGEVRLDSTPGKGSRFSFTIPKKPI